MKSCEANTSKFDCSDSNFIQIGKLCVTRRNMGDSNVLKIPPSANVTVADHKEYCYSSNMKCCWKGTAQTSGCSSGYGSYSGCNRTVCNWTAAKAICENYNYAGKVWRLPTSAEMKNWGEYSLVVGEKGLQLCTHGDGYKINQCNNHDNCYNNIYTFCMAYDYYTGDVVVKDSTTRQYSMRSGTWCGPENTGIYHARSFRCVTEME